MSVLDFFREIEKYSVNDENGISDKIEYTRYKTLTSETLSSFIDSNIYKDDKKEVLKDTCLFMSVFIDYTPSIGDTITYNNNTFYVIDYTPMYPYDILASTNRRHMTSRSSRKEK